jgi:hypothetical protein
MEFAEDDIYRAVDGTFRGWLSDCGQYRVTWHSEVWGVPVRPGYHATVLSVGPDGYRFWSFAAARRPYKTFATAVNACQKNRRLWTRFGKLAKSPRKGRVERVRQMDAKAIIGQKAAAHKIMSILPLWVSTDADPSLIRILFPQCPRRSTQARSKTIESASSIPTTVSTSETPTDGPASNVAAEVKSGKSSGGATSATPLSKTTARPAKGRAPAKGKKSKPPTSKRSRIIKPTSRGGKS